MADGSPTIGRVQAGEDTLERLLLDTDKRLIELERRAFVKATSTVVISVMDPEDLPTEMPSQTIAWVIATQQTYVQGAGGGGVGPGGNWSPGGSYPT